MISTDSYERDTPVALCLGTYEDPKGVGISYERGATVQRERMTLYSVRGKCFYYGPKPPRSSCKPILESRASQTAGIPGERKQAPLALDTPRRPRYTGLYSWGEIKSPSSRQRSVRNSPSNKRASVGRMAYRRVLWIIDFRIVLEIYRGTSPIRKRPPP